MSLEHGQHFEDQKSLDEYLDGLGFDQILVVVPGASGLLVYGVAENHEEECLKAGAENLNFTPKIINRQATV